MGGLASGRTAGDVTGGDRPIFGLYNPRPSGRVGLPSDRGLPETQGTPVVDPNPIGPPIPIEQQAQMMAQMKENQRGVAGQGRMGLSAEDRARHKQMVRRNQVLEARGLPYHQDYSPYIPHMAPPPRGGYSGGVIPRFQSGEQIAQMRASQRGQGQMGLSPQDMARFRARIRRDQHLEARGLPPSEYTGPAGWEPAPRRGTPPATNPPGGWQEGGQLEDPLFPVESELADESPWYPDEEVGYEEAAPMQGGFDIFGRSGG